jgi:hypothetical protein
VHVGPATDDKVFKAMFETRGHLLGHHKPEL